MVEEKLSMICGQISQPTRHEPDERLMVLAALLGIGV